MKEQLFYTAKNDESAGKQEKTMLYSPPQLLIPVVLHVEQYF